MTNNDPYAWWKRALAGGKIGGKDLPVHESEPQPGRYRLRYGKDKPWQPVAIWFDEDGKLIALVSGRVSDEPEAVWISCCRHPITGAEYDQVIGGGEWSDALEPLTPPEVGIGHNEPPDEFALLKEEIEAATVSASNELDGIAVTTQAQADRLGNHVDRLRELSKKAESMRKTAAKPFDDGKKAVQAKYKPILNGVDAAINELKIPITKWMREQERIRTEAARKAQQDAEAAGEEAPQVEAIKPKAGGLSGKRMSLRTQVSAEITDYAKALDHYKDRPEVRDLIQTLANRSARAGETVPGVERIEEKVAA